MLAGAIAQAAEVVTVPRSRDWVDWVTIFLTGAAVAIAIWQSIRSGRIATRAKEAVERAEARLASNQLIGLSTKLQAMEIALGEAATVTEDRDATVEALIEWRQTASELVGMLENQANPDEDVLVSLRAVTSSATAAHAALSDGRASPKVQTKQVRQDVAEALSHLSRHAGALKFSGGTSDDRQQH